MNWIIRRTSKMSAHTYLDVITESFKEKIDDFNWIISDIEYSSTVNVKLPVDMDTNYFILSPADFKILLNSNVQFWWAVILAVPISKEITIDEDNLPSAEFNELIWKNGNLQYPDAQIEIICWDSGYTIVKFTDEKLSNKFKDFFGADAIPLEKFK